MKAAQRRDSLFPRQAAQDHDTTRVIQPSLFSDQVYNISNLNNRQQRKTPVANLPMQASHTSSKKWSSDTALWGKKWERTQRGLRRLFPRSELLEWTYQNYVRHTSEVASINAEKARRAMERAISRSSSPNARVLALMPLNGRKPLDRYAMVLTVETVWRPDFGCDEVYWPSAAEYIYEGNGRMEGEGFGRRLPLPRTPSNGTVSFRLLPWERPRPFDDLEVIPTDPDDICLDFDLLDQADAEFLIGDSLLNALEFCDR